MNKKNMEDKAYNNMNDTKEQLDSQLMGDGNNVEELDDNEAIRELKGKLKEMKLQLTEKTNKCDEYFNFLQRTTAEFENYKRRAVKEKECIYGDSICEVVSSLLPVVDNFERALQFASNDQNKHAIVDGVELVFKQLKDVMKDLGVEVIETVGSSFDPNLHNAVMHIEDESYDKNVIVEEFQKGYIVKGKVIRHSMVKVAN